MIQPVEPAVRDTRFFRILCREAGMNDISFAIAGFELRRRFESWISEGTVAERQRREAEWTHNWQFSSVPNEDDLENQLSHMKVGGSIPEGIFEEFLPGDLMNLVPEERRNEFFAGFRLGGRLFMEPPPRD